MHSLPDEYQYLSLITTPQATTTSTKTPPRRKTIYRRISTTQRTSVPETAKPRTTRKPFEKIPVKEIESGKEIKGIEKSKSKKKEYDYYDDGQEKIGDKYEKETKVILDEQGRNLTNLTKQNLAFADAANLKKTDKQELHFINLIHSFKRINIKNGYFDDDY